MATERAPARLLAPNTLIGGRYTLVRRLAKGGMGVVWLAQNTSTEGYVALKLLHPSAHEKDEVAERFRREARLAGLLGHRSIVRTFDFLEEPDGTLVLVMEFLRGETLEQAIARKGALPSREAIAVVCAILSALQHGHQQGVVHRDVKPSNIFLAVDSDGRMIPKLLDYGIAKMPKNDRSKTQDGVILGTPSYMSPEQIRAEPGLDGRSDLFSCAVVLYEMLTGICPFHANAPSAAIAAVLQSPVDPDARIEPRLWIELQRALAKRPMQRHVSAAEMRAAVLTAVGETEESLASQLRGVPPDDIVSGVVASGFREVQTQSVEGQSVVAVVPSRRGGAWIAWASVGALLGAVLAIGALRHEHAFAPAAAPGAAVPAGAAMALPLPAAPDHPAPPPTGAPATTGPTAAVTSVEALPSASPHIVPIPAAAHPHHAVARPKVPRPIATSPGF